MKQSIEKLLELAIDAHKASQITEADELYATVLRTMPQHPIANFNRGIINPEFSENSIPVVSNSLTDERLTSIPTF